MPTETIRQPAGTVATASYDWKDRSWVRTPNFKTVPKNALPVNPYSSGWRKLRQNIWSGWKYSNNSGSTWTVVYSNIYAYDGNYIWFRSDQMRYYAGTDSIRADVLNDAKIRCLVKAADTKVNLAVALAEAKKTSDLILDTANRIDRAYRAFRRGQFREVARLLEISPNKVHKTWLKNQYGVQPLLMDVKGAAEFFAQQTVGRAAKFVVSGKSKRSFTKSKTTVGTAYNGPWVETDTISGFVEAKVKLWLELTSTTASAAQQLGLTNPALFVWEKIPYSFVFDWFIQVGDYLTAVSALDGITIRRAMESSITESHHVMTAPDVINITNGGSRIDVAGGRYMDTRQRDYLRAVANVSLPQLSVPVNHQALGFKRMVSGLSLIRARW